MLYSGIDLHKRFSFITTVDEQGKVLSQVKVRNDDQAVLKYFASFNQPHQAVVECTMNWYWIAALLNDQDFPCVVAHAKYLKAISYAKVKTDKVDSLTLAQLLRMHYIPASYQVPAHLRPLRDLMRQRLRFVAKRTSHLVWVHMTLGKYNIKLPGQYPLNHPESFQALRKVDIPKPAQLGIRLHLQNIRLLNRQIKLLEKTIKPQLRPTKQTQLLLSVPGIGEIAAATILLETGTIDRFADDKHFASYCRLVPGSADSGGRHKLKHTPKDGNRYLKYVFTESALKAIIYYVEIKQFYQRKLRKTNAAVARTIVAKELARIVYYVLTREEPFKNFKGIAVNKSESWPRLARPVR